jgi:hypothetical protein
MACVHQYDSKWFHLPKNPTYSTSSYSSPSPSPWQPLIFIYFLLLLSPLFCLFQNVIVEVTQEIASSERLLSLSNMLLKSLFFVI